jgi:lysophospholipase L1-like esterase
VLEDRTLLASAAVIQWSMLPQTVRDALHGNQPDLPNTPAYVNPPGGYGVLLDASHSTGILPTTTFSWTVTASNGHQTVVSGEDPTIDLPQGQYSLKLEASGLAGTNRPRIAMTTVQVKDLLVVSIGDSYASGEGNPVVPSAIDPQWAYSPDPAMNTENANAHRSTIAGPAQFALALEQANPHVSVTFVSVANSGASIPVGVLGPMTSIGDSNYKLPAEIAELKQIIGSRLIDVLTVSVGGDDIGFATIAEDLIENTYLGTPTLTQIQTQVDANLHALPQHFAELAQAIQTLNPGQVLMTGYPDITRNQNGKVAAILWGDVTLISKHDAQFASQKIIPPLNAAIAAAARTYNWSLVGGINSNFFTHGYPSTTPWIRTLGESLEIQGDQDGTFHPNALGHQDIARHLLATYLKLGRRAHKGR